MSLSWSDDNGRGRPTFLEPPRLARRRLPPVPLDDDPRITPIQAMLLAGLFGLFCWVAFIWVVLQWRGAP
jgi:hypothetical protein